MLNKIHMKYVEKLIQCTIIVETDFNNAYNLILEIEELKKKAYELKFNLFGSLYKKRSVDNEFKFYLTCNLIKLIYDVNSRVEEVSDYLRGLIIKYSIK